MRLKLKLFLSVSLLVVSFALIFYFFFLTFFKRDFETTKLKVRSLFIEQSQMEREQEMRYFQRRVEDEQKSLNALFPFFFSHGQNALSEEEKITFLQHFLVTHPDIAFVQWRDTKKNQMLTILLERNNKGIDKSSIVKKPLFDDVGYLANPLQKIVLLRFDQELFVGNTIKEGDALLTLGFSLSKLIEELALVSHHVVIATTPVGDIGYTPDGQLLTKEGILQSLEDVRKKEPTLYSKMSLFSNENFSLYLIPSFGEENMILTSFDILNRDLVEQISWELLILIALMLFVSLLILDRLAHKIAEPLGDLVRNTKLIKEGNLKAVSFQDMKKRKDEIATLNTSFKEMVEELREKERMRSLLNKIVSKDIAEEILKSDVHLGGEDRIATIMFADIRNFTEITHALTPQQTIKLLNDVMTKVSKIIESEGGVIDKYVGDEVMAIYGTPIFHPDHALRALSSAKLIVETLKKWNIEREKLGEPVIEMGIGINTGPVVAGNMGAEDRLNYTVLGPSVNLASRLCKAALPMQIIISEFTLKQKEVAESFYVESLLPIALKGFPEPVNVFQVTGFKWNE